MTLYEIDPDTTRRRIEAATAGGLRALGDLRQRSADVDTAIDGMLDRQERAAREMDERVRLAAAAREKDEPADEARPRPRTGTLALGAEEFREAREARKTAGQPAPADPQPAQEKPQRRRPPAQGGDDDMSGRTWLRR